MSDWPFTQIGLILDIIGATIVFFNIVPIKNDTERKLEDYDPDAEAKKILWIKRKAQTGYFLLVLGFVLQYVGTIK